MSNEMNKDKFGFVELKDVCNINMGQSPDSDSYNDNEDGIPFFQGNADFGEMYPTTRKWCNAPTKIAQADDILISVRAPIGALNYAKEECCIGRGLAAITPNQDKVSSEFIYWLLKGKNKELNLQGTGSTFKAISRKVLEEIKVPDIELKKQKELAGNLEKVYSVIQLRKQQLEELDTLIKARFVEMFGNPIDNSKGLDTTEFINVVKLQRGFDLPVQDRNQEGNILVFGSNGALDRHDVAKVAGGGVITGRSGTIGKVYYTLDDYWPLNTSLFSVDLHGNNIIYLAYLLEMFDLSRFADGTGVPTLNRNNVHNKQIICVPRERQDEFANFVTQVDKLKVEVQKSLDELQILFDSLMQQYFG